MYYYLIFCNDIWFLKLELYWLIYTFGNLTALIRHNKPGVAAFRLANGYAALKDALTSDNVRFQR
jgi:hsp70-interacting protein